MTSSGSSRAATWWKDKQVGLREVARQDARRILGDADGFAWPLTVTDPDGRKGCINGFSSDVGELIDAQTGVAISGRQVEVTLHVDDLNRLGFGHPEYIASEEGKPWLIEFPDIEGTPGAFKVMRTAPDLTTGVILCFLEAYVA